MAKRHRIDDVFAYICTYADENNGITPPVRVIAAAVELSTSRIQYLMMRLKAKQFIREVGNTKSYKVVDADWEYPPYVKL